MSGHGGVSTQHKPRRRNWCEIVDQAAEIVRSYSTGVTLRQLFYRLVSAEVLPNTTSAYKTLSARTAEARREDGFPALIDRTRTIRQVAFSAAPADAINELIAGYRLDRTEGQEVAIYLGVEKIALVGQLWSWFGDLGVPILALGGYASQTYCDEIADHVEAEGRGAVLIYAGDFDPSGEDIDRDLEERTDHCFQRVVRIALNPDQIELYGLPPQLGKATDARANGFVARHGGSSRSSSTRCRPMCFAISTKTRSIAFGTSPNTRPCSSGSPAIARPLNRSRLRGGSRERGWLLPQGGRWVHR
jgi:hypothetical protein